MSTRREFLTATATGFLSLPALSFDQGTSTRSNAAVPSRVLIIPHTHWEGAVFKTREEYLKIGLPNIVKALFLLKKYPDYHFVLDQMCYVRPFLQRYPSEEAALRRFLAEGRLQIVGGTYAMHDNNMPSGESIVRQFLVAKSFFRERLDYDVTAGWALDTFGHNAQMPQILKLAGMKSYWFMRGVRDKGTPTEFFWRGLDGSTIPAFWLAIGYGPLGDVPSGATEFGQLLRRRASSLAAFSHHSVNALLAGSDVSEPNEALPILVAQFNESSKDLSAEFAVPTDFEALVSSRLDRPTIQGEFNPVGEGIYSSRIELKEAMRQLETQLITAEKLSVIASVLTGTPNSDTLDSAWLNLLFNEEHDPAAGSVVDKVYEEEKQDYRNAMRVADEAVSQQFAIVAGQIDTSGDGVAIMVFNVLAWERTDYVELDIPFSEPAVRGFVLFDSARNSVPVQFLNTLRNGDGGIRQARVVFIAKDMPAMGYAVFHAVANHPASPDPKVSADEWFYSSTNSAYKETTSIENQFYRASFDPISGAMTSLVLKESNWEVLSAPGNVVAQDYDGGDFWDVHTEFSGDIVGSKKSISAPRSEITKFSSDFGGRGSANTGPVYSEFSTRGLSDDLHPFGKNRFASRVRIYRGMPRIDIHTQLVNQEEFVRYRAIFPTNLKKGVSVHEIPFGAIERKQNQEFPALNWIDYGDGRKGLTLINAGIPGNNVADGQLMLSLMRSARMTWPLTGGNEPGVRSDGGLGVGMKYAFDYALIPHSGDWRAAKPWRAGMEFNNPLLARTVATHAGKLPARWGMLEVMDTDVVVTALKPGKQGTAVLRMYEASGRPAHEVQVQFSCKVEHVREANLIEDDGMPIAIVEDRCVVGLRPFEIKTLKFKLSLPSA